MELDMTRGTPWKQILRFSLPILGGMLLQLLYTTVDAIIVGNFIGDTALGAVNSSISYTQVLLAVATGLSAGCAIVLSQLYGAKDRAGIRNCISTMRILVVALGLMITVVGVISADSILNRFLGVPAELMMYASAYIKVYLLGMVFQFAYNALAAELRAVGNSRATLIFLLCASITNIVLDILFVAVFAWGVAGAAAATVFAQAVSAVASYLYIEKNQPLLRLSIREYVFSKDKCGLILKLGIPVALQTITVTAGMMFIQRLVNSFGASTMAAIAVGHKVDSFVLTPNNAFAMGMSTFAGQNAGAGDFKRVRKGLLSGLCIAVSVSAAICLLVYCLAPLIMQLFGCKGDSLAFGTEYLRFMACILILSAILFITRGMLQGVGDAGITSILTLGALAIRIIMAYWMSGWPSVGRNAIYYCMGIDFLISTCAFAVRYFSCRWEKKVVVRRG